MSTVFSGRAPKNTAFAKHKKKRRFAAADITALICAALCAGCLVTWSINQKQEDIIAAAVIYDTPTEEKGFWDYFSELVASAFGYNG